MKNCNRKMIRNGKKMLKFLSIAESMSILLVFPAMYLYKRIYAITSVYYTHKKIINLYDLGLQVNDC